MEPPLDYQIDPARRYVCVTYSRQPTFQQWSAVMETIFADPGRDSGFGILLDRRRITFPASTDFIKRMTNRIEILNRKFGEVPWALLVADLASFGVGRMAEQIGRTDAIRTFHDIGSAEKWILSFAGRDG